MFSHAHNSFSRRSIVKGSVALAGVSVLGLATRSVHSQTAAPRVRMDIATFAQDTSRLARFEAAVKQMQDASAGNSGTSRSLPAPASAKAMESFPCA